MAAHGPVGSRNVRRHRPGSRLDWAAESQTFSGAMDHLASFVILMWQLCAAGIRPDPSHSNLTSRFNWVICVMAFRIRFINELLADNSIEPIHRRRADTQGSFFSLLRFVSSWLKAMIPLAFKVGVSVSTHQPPLSIGCSPSIPCSG